MEQHRLEQSEQSKWTYKVAAKSLATVVLIAVGFMLLAGFQQIGKTSTHTVLSLLTSILVYLGIPIILSVIILLKKDSK